MQKTYFVEPEVVAPNEEAEGTEAAPGSHGSNRPGRPCPAG
jgi:hypothetical protein